MNTVGEFVMYKNGTICRVSDICDMDFGGENRTYYVLDTVGQNSSRIYLPVDSPVVLRHVLGRDEIYGALDEAAREIAAIDEGKSSESPLWRSDPKERAAAFTSIISGGDRVMILRMISLLAHNRESLAKLRKKLYASDERAYQQGVKLIGEEFSFVLGIPKEDIAEFITSKLYGNDNQQ